MSTKENRMTKPVLSTIGQLRCWRYDETDWVLRNGKTWIDAASGSPATQAQAAALDTAVRELDEILTQAEADEDARLVVDGPC